jgi:hypothetical protein
MFLRQSTASQEVSLGYFLDSTDGNSAENGLTIANTDIKIRKGGGTTLTNKNSGGATNISDGIYSAVLDATDTNTLGDLVIYCHPTGALATKIEYTVLPAASYDALITNGLNDLSAAQVNAEVDTALSDYDGPTNAEMEARTVTSSTYATAANLAVVDDVVDAILVDTDDLQSNQGNFATATGFATVSQIADVPTVAEFNARTIVSANYATASNLAAVDTVVDAILVDTGTTLPATLTDMSGSGFSTSTDSLEALRNRGDSDWVTGGGGSAPTVAQIRTEMDDNSTKLASILTDTGTTIPATLTDMSGPTFSTSTDSLEAIRNRGDSSWTTGAGGSSPTVEQIRAELDDNSTKLAAILLDTAEIANVPTVTQFNARTLLAADYFDPASDAVANVTLVDTTTTNTDMLSASDVLTTQMTESYAADGTAPTLAEAIFLSMQNLQDFSFSGTTQTVKKIDGSTTAATYTLDDASAPTSKTRAS